MKAFILPLLFCISTISVNGQEFCTFRPENIVHDSTVTYYGSKQTDKNAINKEIEEAKMVNVKPVPVKKIEVKGNLNLPKNNLVLNTNATFETEIVVNSDGSIKAIRITEHNSDKSDRQADREMLIHSILSNYYDNSKEAVRYFKAMKQLKMKGDSITKNGDQKIQFEFTDL